MPVRRRRRTEKKVRRLLALLAVMALIAGGFVWVDIRLRPVVESYSRAQTQREASLAADRAVTDALTAVDAAALLQIRRDTAGNIQSVETDMAQVNRLKATVTERITGSLAGTDLTVSIPVGTLTGSELLTGRGPRIPIRISRSATVITFLNGRFEGAGINQTNHQLWLTVQITAVCAISGFRQITVTAETEYLIAETVLVGMVPDTFADLGLVE